MPYLIKRLSQAKNQQKPINRIQVQVKFYRVIRDLGICRGGIMNETSTILFLLILLVVILKAKWFKRLLDVIKS